MISFQILCWPGFADLAFLAFGRPDFGGHNAPRHLLVLRHRGLGMGWEHPLSNHLLVRQLRQDPVALQHPLHPLHPRQKRSLVQLRKKLKTK